MKELDVYMVRHGETLYNLLKRMQGWSDSPLTNRSLPLLEQTGERLKNMHFDHVYSSDLKRALDTNEIILKHNQETTAKVISSSNFREIFFGSFEGQDEEETWQTIGKPYGIKSITEFHQGYSNDFLRDATKSADKLNLAENAEEVHQRMRASVKQLLAENENHSQILLTTHGGFIKDFVDSDLVSNKLPISEFPRNGSITHVKISEQDISIESYNQ